MKNKIVSYGLMLFTALMLTGCNSCRNDFRHLKSSVTGLQRTITLYNNNGQVIKEWKTSGVVEDKGGSFYFLDNNNKAVYVSGTLVITED